MSKDIEKYVCTLEQAKRLKELGVNHDSLFYWTCIEVDNNNNLNWNISRDKIISNGHEQYSAFTSQELGELITKYFGRWSQRDGDVKCQFDFDNPICEDGYYYHYIYHDYNETKEPGYRKTEAQLRAEIFIYLLEQHK